MFFNTRNAFNELPISDICSNLFAGGDKPSDCVEEKSNTHPYPVIANGVGDSGIIGYVPNYQVDRPSLTISARGTIGYCAIREPFFTPVVRLITIIPNDKVNLTYLKFYLEQTGFEHTGAVQGQLTIPTLKQKKVLVPSIEEQNSFSAIVAQADKSKFSCLKSQFIEMFGGNKVDYVQLSSLCLTFIDGDWIESKDQSESGIRLIQTGNVGCGEYKDKGDKAKYITEDTFNKLHCTEIYPGDILISRLPDPVGRACVLPEGLGKCVTAVDCTIIRFSEKILPNFFVAYTNTPEYLTQIKSTLAGTTRLRVSRGNLGKVKIPVPSIEQQRTFVSIAEQADKSKQIAFSRAS